MPSRPDLESSVSKLKRGAKRSGALVRAVRATYPALSWIENRPAVYLRQAPYLARMRFDDVRLGGRGNEPEAHLRRTARLHALQGSDILVVGAGRGDELDLWSQQRPRSLTAVEYLDHASDWHARPEASFARMDARTLAFAPASFDVVASTALLEHIDGVDAAMREMARIVRPGGVVFANFGPLYYTYGGAHYDGAYEHLAMSDAELERYLVQRNIPGELEDGLVWVRNGMFSKLRYDEYLAIFERYFHLEHVTLAVSPPAMRFRRERPSEWRYLTARYDEADLLTYAMTVWLRPLPVALSSRRRQRGAAA